MTVVIFVAICMLSEEVEAAQLEENLGKCQHRVA